MYREQYKKNWINKGVIGGAACLILLIILIVIFIRPKFNEIREAKSSLNEARKELSAINSVTDSILEYREKQKEAWNITDNFLNYMVSPGSATVKNTDFLTENTGIKTKKITEGTTYYADTGYLKQLWKINFNGNYKDILNLLQNIENAENFMGIENIHIVSGGMGDSHSAEVVLYTVVRVDPDNFPVTETTDKNLFLKLPETVLKEVEKLVRLTESHKGKIIIGKDPMSLKETLFKDRKGRSEQKKSAPTPPRLSLDGIVWDDTTPVAIINGEIKKEGERIRGATVAKIDENYVLVKWGTRYIRLQMELK